MKRKFLVCLSCVSLSLFINVDAGDKKSTNSLVNPEMDKKVRDVAGFAKYLPKNSEMFFNAQGIDGLISAMRGSEIGEKLAELAKKEGGDIDEIMKSDEFQEFINVAGEEVFFGMGDGSANAVKGMAETYGVYYRMYYYMAGKMMIDALGEGDFMNNPEQFMMSMMKPVIEELLEIEDYQMPRVVAGFKVSNEKKRAKYTKLIQDGVAMALDLNENDEVKRLYGTLFEEDSADVHGGFKGVKIDYAKLMKKLKDEPMPEMEMMGFTAEYVEKFAEKFKDFKLTLLVGNYKDYVVIYMGDTSEGLKFVEKPSDSLLANDEMSFLKEYKGREVVSVTYVSKEISEKLSEVTTMMEDLSVGAGRFLAETEILGDTSHIVALLKKIAGNSIKLKALSSPSRFGSVAYLEDGFKVDSFHGSKSVMYDLESRRKLADIAMRDDAVLSSSWVVNGANTELTIQSLEDMVNLAYQVTKSAVEHDVDDEDFLQFANMFKILDGQFSDDLLSNWKVARDGLREGLGNEGALVMDLKGKMPRVPDVPTVLLEKGKVPRLAIGYDVKDRAKLADSWKTIDATNRKIVSKVESMMKQKINYRTPELAEKKGIDFWSYQLGITSHEANLALGINDKMMFLNTSPSFVEGFVPEYNADGRRGGLDSTLRFTPIRKAILDWMKLVDKHGEELSPSFDRDEFEESSVLIRDLLKTSEELDSVDFSMRKVNGEVRSFFHLNKRNK